MVSTGSIIETGVDKLVNLVNARGRIAASDAAKELGVSSTVVMEWADFLEEEGIINIEYKFTKPYLVARKLGKKDIQGKEKEFTGKKDVFIRKAEVSISFLKRESERLKSLKDEFEKIKQSIGLDIGSIKNELEELKNYEHLKINLDKQIEDQKTSSMERLQEISRQILGEKKKYQEIITEIKKEEEMLKRDQIRAKTLEESEKLINERLENLKLFINNVESKTKSEVESVKISESNIQKLLLMTENAKIKIEKEKNMVDPLVKKSTEQAEKIKNLQAIIIQKIISKEKKLKGAKEASIKMRNFFKKKLGVLGLVETINKDNNLLQNEFIEIIKKARSFELSSKSADVGDQIIDLEKKFKEIDSKKKTFEKDLKQLSSFFK